MSAFILNKKIGETPLECLERFKKENPEYADKKLTYAGRLDPIAEGLLLVLEGEEIKNKEHYLNLEKEYVFDVLFGISTDTHDILGIIDRHASRAELDNFNKSDFVEKFQGVLRSLIGSRTQPYPLYSSKPVSGKPLFAHAREGTADDIDIPTKVIEIKKLELQDICTISRIELEERVIENICLVGGDFRQKEILTEWKSYFQNFSDATYLIAHLTVVCSSGTYVRSLADTIGKLMKIPSMAFSIKRTRVGEFWVLEKSFLQ